MISGPEEPTDHLERQDGEVESIDAVALPLARNAGLYSLPIILRIASGILMVPLTTYKLGPTEFGVFALVTGLTLIGSGIAQVGGTFFISQHFPLSDAKTRSELITTLIWVSTLVAIIFSVLLIVAWPLLTRWSAELDGASYALRILTIAAMIAGIPWGLAVQVALLEGRSAMFSTVTILQILIGSVATLGALYLFNAGATSLAVGALAGNLVLAVGAILLLRPFIRRRPTGGWASKILRLAPSTSAASIAEVLQLNFERYLLLGVVNLREVGLYTHGQNYRSLVISGTNVVSSTVWPVTLSEARDVRSQFPETKKWWTPVHVLTGLAGIVFAAFGREVLAILTHGKFNDAGPIVALLMVLVLLQLIFRPHLGVAYAAGLAREMSHARVLVTVVIVVISFPLVRYWSAAGLIAALALGELAFRLRIWQLATKIRKLPLQDTSAWVSIAAILVCVAVSEWVEPELTVRIVMSLAAVAAVVLGSGLLNRFRTKA